MPVECQLREPPPDWRRRSSRKLRHFPRDGNLTTAESIFVVERAPVSELAARYMLPAIYPNSIQVTDAGGLMAYDINYPDLLSRAAAVYAEPAPQCSRTPDSKRARGRKLRLAACALVPIVRFTWCRYLRRRGTIAPSCTTFLPDRRHMLQLLAARFDTARL